MMTTLETDIGITSDGAAVLSHDPHILSQKCRRSDGKPYAAADEVLISQLKLPALQADYVCDKVFRGPEQKNDPALSPVAAEFARTAKLPSLYSVPTVQQLFDFVSAYVVYYRDGAGRAHPEAALRVRNAQKVRFNIETKINPRKEYAALTTGPDAFADTLAAVIERNGLAARADIQSFDFRTLLRVQKMHPQIRTVCLFGDFPRFSDSRVDGSDDGTNLQDEDGRPTPWLAGLPWPYRITASTNPQRVRASGGFEGMALSADGTRLLPVLEKPLVDEQGFVRVFEFDLRDKRYLPAQHRYALTPGATAVSEFLLLDEHTGLALERDDSEGSLSGLKHIYRFELPHDPGERPLGKELMVNLMDIADPDQLAGTGQPGDIGLGARFAMPYFTIEAILVLGPDRLAVMNDNNLPFSVGRHLGTRAPDDNEFIVLQLPRALPLAAGAKF
jgi:glycerophosphoryl diester phosphodiesterase